eukprot:TRINITY_DN68175_c0_g1_i1.p1 TRINITY_DN68175_c0_g1~~TRINITY_DN68175_c0_g1_i1.p1  ORF type:complete len:674 (+),score=80.03 TRINITY_DN68175_c0_g1_i1:60-2024(+)
MVGAKKPPAHRRSVIRAATEPLAFLPKDEQECCICFGTTPCTTPCNHSLCAICWATLQSWRRLHCPLCRRDLPPPPETATDSDDKEDIEGEAVKIEAPKSPRSQFLSTVGNRMAWRTNSTKSRLPSITTPSPGTTVSGTLPATRQITRRSTVRASGTTLIRTESDPTLAVAAGAVATTELAADGIASPQTRHSPWQHCPTVFDGSTSPSLRRSFTAIPASPSGNPTARVLALRATLASWTPASPTSPSSSPTSPGSSSNGSHRASSSTVATPSRVRPQQIDPQTQQQRGRRFRISKIVSRICKMTLAETSRFIEHAVWLQVESLVTPAETQIVSRALRRRVVELFSKLSIESASSAGDLLCLLAEHSAACPALSTDSPRRALEARLTCCFYRSGDDGVGSSHRDEIETMARCHAEVAALAERKLIDPKMGEIATGHVTRWVEQAPLATIYQSAAVVRRLADSLPNLHALLSGRMQRLALQRFDAGQLLGYVLILLDFRENGLALLDASLEARLVEQLCVGINRWSTERLTTELGDTGALRLLCEASEMVCEAVRDTLLTRVLGGPHEIIQSLRRQADYARVRAELTAWGRLVHVGGSAGVLALTREQRHDIVDQLSDCTSRCMASKELRPHVEELEKAQMAVMILTAGVRAAND